ncbi:hypothetical protein evm_006019 [Chilo suppressalis]|nr:hypothetical protein evm_006019 [Chilo suppressalis]
MYPSADNEDGVKDPMEILEDALVLCTFGRFHIRLLLTTMAASCASMIVTTTTSYIVPNAECDLNMTIIEKGLLTSMPFFGQVSCSLIAGFVTDAFGRKRFLVGGFFGIFICAVIEGSSQTFWMLAIAKLLAGVCSCFCFTIPVVLLSELVHKHVRDRVLLINASFMSISLITIAFISWGLLPLQLDITVIEGYFVLHSWNIYLYVCSIFSLIAAISYYYLPESPKFLLSHGQENKALEIMKDIYQSNTRNHRDTFPITSLNASGSYVPTTKDTFKKQIINALLEVKNLFRPPLRGRLCLFCIITFVCLLAYSSLRMWYPQISTMVENYQQTHNRTDRFCAMITEYTQEKLNYEQKIDGILNPPIGSNLTVSELDANDTEICVPHISGTETYTNGILLGFVSFIGIGISTYVVKFFGVKPLMIFLLIICGACSASLYWTNSLISMAILISTTCGFMQTAMSLQYNLLMRAFPTTLRTLSVSIITMIGRIGSLLGSILFPVMLTYGCMTPFIALSVLSLAITSLVYFLPSPSDKNHTGDK